MFFYLIGPKFLVSSFIKWRKGILSQTLKVILRMKWGWKVLCNSNAHYKHKLLLVLRKGLRRGQGRKLKESEERAIWYICVFIKLSICKKKGKRQSCKFYFYLIFSFWLCWVFVVVCRLWNAQGSVVVAFGLGHLSACRILVPYQG